MSNSFSGLTRPRHLLILAAAATTAAILSASIMFKKSKKKDSKKQQQQLTTMESSPFIPEKEECNNSKQEDNNRSWADDIAEEEEIEVKIAEVASAMAHFGLEDVGSTPTRRDSGIGSPDEANAGRQGEEPKMVMRAPTPPSSVDEVPLKKDRCDSGCSYGTSDEVKLAGKVVTSADSGNGSTEGTDGIIFAYHFAVPSTLCGQLIGTKGKYVRQLREATKCSVVVDYPSKASRTSGNEDKVCIIEGTRSAIDRCLLLIRERLPLSQFPSLTLEQINLPQQKDVTAALITTEPLMPLTLTPGQLNNVIVSSIVSGNHIFVQQLDHPTFGDLERLESCMFSVYESLSLHRKPKVQRDHLVPGLVCVAKFSDRYYRLQVFSYDTTQESCDVKFLDYGGYDVVNVDDLLEIRSDFTLLPIQAVECYLANVIPPTGAEWPYESVVHLEELVHNQSNSCRVVGISPDYIPIVQLFSTSLSKSTKEIETRFVNKELVERGAAIWVEHSIAA